MRRGFESEAIEAKWLARWREAGVYDARRGHPGDKKFFLHFAYPGISGYLHVGHLRGFSYSDVFVRYKRMTGHRVFFPAGFHASGIPSVGLARKVERRDAAMLEYLRANGTPEDVIPRLQDPRFVVEYFGRVYADDYWRRFGYLIDWRSLCTTIDPGYNRFIQWQFRRLNDRGLLTVKPHFGPHCPLDGAVAVDASETDISRGGNAEINEYTLLRFTHADGTILPCATLRPETVYGVTNLWLNPAATYVVAAVGGERWCVSQPAFEKLRGQRDDVGADASTLVGDALAAWMTAAARNPFTGAAVPILPAPFVDPNRATGVVMSVPAHAPFDWQALREIRPEIQPIVIIRNPKARGVPAEEAVRRHGVKSQADKAALDAATEEVYADEFHGGEMLPNTNRLAGLKVSAAKEETKAILQQLGQWATFQDFNMDVVCRCGRPVHVRRIPDQWFLRYSDAALTEEAKRHAATMNVYPEEYRRDLPAVLDWFGDRACIRKGSWLGTEFPFKAGWIIEPISDSTFYAAYYLVAPYVNAGRLRAEELTDAFFDYVFLGAGRPASPVWEEVRQDFDFWYPVDINLGGKEHKTVHFPPYVMNHVALVPPEKRPRGIFVNWWVTQKAGEKISKSKGGAEPIPNAAKRYSVDGMRLYYSHVSSAHVDLEWDPDTVLDYRARVARLHQFVADLADAAGGTSPAGVDEWLAHAWTARVAAARAAFEAFDLRDAANHVYFEFYNDLQWWRRRGGRPTPAALDVVRAWVRSMGPITPFVAEELHELLGATGFVLDAAFPEPAAPGDAGAGAREEYLRAVLEDIHSIVRVTNIKPKRIVVHTAPAWKRAAEARVRDAVTRGERNPGDAIKALLADPALRPHARDIPAFVQRTFKDAVQRRDGNGHGVDEFEVLSSAAPFLSKELESQVEVYRADDPTAPDPGKKRAVAAPRKPALYVE